MLSDEEMNKFLLKNTPANTVRKTESDLKIFKKWMAENLATETRNIEEIEPCQLNQILKTFFIKVKKSDGSFYEPDSIKSMQNSLERYLTTKNYQASILRGDEFKGSREVMSAKRKELKHEGLGRKPNRAKPISDDEEEMLWRSGQLGAHNPVSLQNAIWWRNNFFGLRGRQEHRNMRWGDITIQTETNGEQYIEFCERDTKTRKDPRQERAFNPKIYATPERLDRCPVNLLIQFTHKRPMSMIHPDSPFYLTVLPPHQMKANTWYKACPLGIHSLGEIMKTMCKNSGLDKHTNHSGRKTTVKRLREASIESNDIIQLTGHKSIQSVNNYSDVSVKMQKQMSKILVTGPQSSSEGASSIRSPVINSVSSTVGPLVATPVKALALDNPVSSTAGSLIAAPVGLTPSDQTLVNPDQYIFDPGDNFQEVVSEIEKFESGIAQNMSKSVVPNGSFSNCTLNFTVNFTQ